jgi:hypothetical protein
MFRQQNAISARCTGMHHLAPTGTAFPPNRAVSSQRDTGGITEAPPIGSFPLHPIPHYHGAYLCRFDFDEPLGFRSWWGSGYGVGGMGQLGRGGAGRRRYASLVHHPGTLHFYIATAPLKTGVVAMRRRCGLVLVTARDGMQKGCLGLRTAHRSGGQGHRCTVDLVYH